MNTDLTAEKRLITTLLTCLGVLWLGTACAQAQIDRQARNYAFVYLGDMHFDQAAHHDFEWVRATKPNDMRQIDGYIRNTEMHTPKLLQRIQGMIASPDSRIRMVIQGGDLTEGLCGSQALQERQFKDTLACIGRHIPATPFVMVKGNHDVTGPGARAAFDAVMLPWLSGQCGKTLESASFFFMQGPDLYVFFDAYHNRDVAWLEATLNQNPHRYVFVVMHPPAVPYTARSTWHVFSRDNEQAQRARFLNVLGEHRVILLTAHLHKYHVLTRKTQTGRFVQCSINSVITSPDVSAKNPLQGIERYSGALVELEPGFQPETKVQRQHMLEHEKPAIAYFEFAEFPGYAVLQVSDAGVELESYLDHSAKPWRRLSLSALLD